MRVAQAEIEPLTRYRMQRLRRIADCDSATLDECIDGVQAERERARAP